jgi:hypothetical protein
VSGCREEYSPTESLWLVVARNIPRLRRCEWSSDRSSQQEWRRRLKPSKKSAGRSVLIITTFCFKVKIRIHFKI